MSALKKKVVILVMLISSILLSVFSIIYLIPDSAPETFYVGITYCGESAEEAKQLIDRVKGYTNLFVLQSGPLQHQTDKIIEIGDYAVSSGMHFIFYFGKDNSDLMKDWLTAYDGHWNDNFLGIYFSDERGGVMLDGTVIFGNVSGNYVSKGYGGVSVTRPDTTTVNYFSDDRITVGGANYTLNYYSSNEITKLVPGNDTHPMPIEVNVDPSTVESYDDLWSEYPFITYESTTEVFVEDLQSPLNYLHEQSVTSFTSDYVLYWFDYMSGYDVVMAQIGWNHTMEQDIALVRGAANMHNKKWAAMITWKYNNPPYLDTGEAIFSQMTTAYEAGADYVVVFNYAEDMTGPYGTLQEEHFVALERFWDEVVQKQEVTRGSVKADAVLVLPEDYGWGMRDPNDKIWGIWGPDEKSSQIWVTSQSLLDQYGLGLDIIYNDSQFPVEGKYSEIFYWDQQS